MRINLTCSIAYVIMPNICQEKFNLIRRAGITNFSIYGINAPGAESFNPLPKFSKQTDSILNLFIGGLEKLCMASTLLSSFRGVVGRLISSSDGVGGVRVPDGVEAFPDTEDPLCFVLIFASSTGS